MAELLYLLLHIAWVSKVLVVSWETELLFGIVLSRVGYQSFCISLHLDRDIQDSQMPYTQIRVRRMTRFYQMKCASTIRRVELYIANMVH